MGLWAHQRPHISRFRERSMTTPSNPLYREIPLTQGQVTLVSAHRYEELSKHKWCASWMPSTHSFYAVRKVRDDNGKKRILRMNRQILGLTFGDKWQGDHINHDTLDNRDENLRVCTPSENLCNKGITSRNVSGFKGVCWNKQKGKWQARVGLNGKKKHVGFFSTPEVAYEAYCVAAKEIHGEFAYFEATR